ncbi:MAG: cytidine deaminase [Terriglobales bacterium]
MFPCSSPRKSLLSKSIRRYNGQLLFFTKIGLSMQTTKVSTAMRERLLRSARKVMKNAYAPFSHFRVGAAILTSKGRVFVGCNVENSSYGMTNCAERTAIFSAIAKDGPELEIQAVAVVASPNVVAPANNHHGVPCSPCGACRQVIYEFGPRAVIFYQGKRGPKQSLVTDLLPEGFRLK